MIVGKNLSALNLIN